METDKIISEVKWRLNAALALYKTLPDNVRRDIDVYMSKFHPVTAAMEENCQSLDKAMAKYGGGTDGNH